MTAATRPGVLSVATESARLSWTGPVAPGDGPSVRSVRGAPLDVDGETAGALVEEGRYAVLVQSRTGAPVALRSRDPVLTAGLATADDGRVLHGTLRTGSQTGRLRVLVTVGGRPEIEVEWDVQPTKVTVGDVHAMRAEVEAAGAGLTLAALRPLGAAASPDGRPSPPAALALARAAVPRLADALRRIRQRPRADVRAEPARARRTQVRRIVPATVRALRLSASGPLPTVRAAVTLDTAAHRWLAARLDRARRRLRRLRAAEARRTPTARRRAVLADLDRLADALDPMGRQGPLAEPGGPAPVVPPLALRRLPAYADAYAALRLLDVGLGLAHGEIETGMQDLAVLYERWAALAVVRVVAEALGVEGPASPFGVQGRGTDVGLRHGPGAAVRLDGAAGRVEIVYAPRFRAPTALLAQRPDLLLTVTPAGGVPQRVVLDAKYRRDDSAAYRQRHGAAGPPESALGALHRYRDAIVGPDGRLVSHAVALFPDRPDRFETSRLWARISDLGVGAVPFLPGETRALRRLIDAWLGRA